MGPRVRGRAGWALLAAALAACAGPPLGEDWEQLDPGARDARAVETLRGLFAERVDGVGAACSDRVVLAVDERGVSYRHAPEAEVSRLLWGDVEAVEAVSHEELPARPVNLLLYLRDGARTADTARDVVEPFLASAGLMSRYVELRLRPRDARRRLQAALNHLRGRARAAGQEAAPSAGVAPVASAASPSAGRETAPQPASEPAAEGAPAGAGVAGEPTAGDPPGAEPASGAAPAGAGRPDLEDVEARLRKLKEWREAGLITPEDYERERVRLLSGM